ncbi:MAG: patatin-like phospholipase family protein [Alphaproteobacteria bacterium]|nr:patatin-like phospholipase family protein [Alphaproteobacteria bacterium]
MSDDGDATGRGARPRAKAKAKAKPAAEPGAVAAPALADWRPKHVNLALQGGGSHGAFTWGVIERLMDEERIIVDGISGTSAGAMNAAVMAAGYAGGGRQGARDALASFWHRIAAAGKSGPIQRTPWDKAMGNFRLDTSPSYVFFDMLGRLYSPYQLNPMNQNPLKDVLEQSIDFEMLRRPGAVRLYVSATNVRSGKIKVFQNDEMCIEALLASACLPFMFQAVEYKGEHYYDGGYMGNPAIFPLIYGSATQDVIIVQINPLYREEVPTSAREILDRVNEISFNSTLMREMRAVYFVTRLIDTGKLDPNEYRRMHVHMIENEEKMRELHASSKLNADPEFLEYLRGLGRDATEHWLERNFDKLGEESTVDLLQTYL